MKQFKRILALILAVCMVFTMLPSVFAADAPAKGPSDGASWVVAGAIEVGKTYVIVADGQYAMTNRQEGPALRTYAGSATTTLASAPVTVEDGKITSAVTDDMLWTVEESTATAAYDGLEQYFLKDAAGNYLRRGSGSSGQGCQLLVEANLYSTIRYNTWSFYAYEGEGAFAMYANSERAYGTDYPFYIYGNETSFDSPGRAQRSEDDPFAFTRNDDCAHVQLFEMVEGSAGINIDFTNPADASKFIVDNQTVSEIQEGQGFYMISTNESFEDCKGQLSGDAATTPRDAVQVPVSGDWTATLYLKVDTSGSNGQYEFICLYGMADYDNGCGIRAGNGSTVNYKEVGGVNESSIDGMKVQTGLTSGTDHWYRLEKVGTSYTGYLSADGEDFQKVFTYEDTGIEAKMIVIDAYSGRSVGYQYWLQSLTFEGEGPAPCEHDYQAVVTAPTCTEGGYTTYTCAKCGDSYVADEVAALGHDYQNGVCTRCGAIDPAAAAGSAYLAAITLDGVTMTGFEPDKFEYELSGDDYETAPVVGYIAPGANSTLLITGSDFQEPATSYTRSDYAQNGNYGPQQTILKNIIGNIQDSLGTASYFIGGGDYNFDEIKNSVARTNTGIDKVREAVQQSCGEDVVSVFVQGNHDAPGANYSPTGPCDQPDFGLFTITEEDYRSYPQDSSKWSDPGNSEAKAQAVADQLEAYLAEKTAAGFDKPVFVASHVPIHYNTRTASKADAIYGDVIYKVLHKYGDDLNIIFLYGHNHAWGDDDYLGGAANFLTRGDTINIAKHGSKTEFTVEPLNFTYMNYGYTGYYWAKWVQSSSQITFNEAADSTLTMTAFQISGNQVIVSRWDENGMHVLKAVGVESLGLRPQAEVCVPDTREVESPVTVKAPKNPAAGSALQVTIEQFQGIPGIATITAMDPASGASCTYRLRISAASGPVLDKTALDAAIAAAEAVNKSKYTEESVAAMEAALAAAKAVADDQAAIDAAAAALNAAVAALVKKPVEPSELKLGPNVIKDPDSPTGYTVKFLYRNDTATAINFNGDISLRNDADRSDTRTYDPTEYRPGLMRGAGYSDKPMEKRSFVIDGEEMEVWYYEVPLACGANQYWFTTPGSSTMIADPANTPIWSPTAQQKNGYNYVYIPYDEKQNYEVLKAREAENPRDDHKGTWSYVPIEIGGTTHHAGVYLPYGYDASREQPYKTIWILHGGGQDESDWMNIGSVQNIMDNLAAEGRTEPAVIVSPTTNNNMLGSERDAYANLFNVVLPFIEEHYNVSRNKMDRAFGGLSMGSMNTQNIINANTTAEKFGYYGPWSGGVSVQANAPGIEYAHILFAGGSNDFGWSASAGQSVENLINQGVYADYMTVTGAHDFNTWCQMFRIWCEDYLWKPAAFGDGGETDTAALEAKIAEAEAIDTEPYTDRTVANLVAAIEAAKGVVADPLNQRQIDKALSDLENAIARLKEKPSGPVTPTVGSSIDFTNPADAGKYEISGQTDSELAEGEGLALIATQGGVEPAKQSIAEADIDVVKVPVSGDWTATLEVEFDANGAANGYYQFFGFYASQGGDNQNMVGIRGGDGAMQDFIRKDGAITEETQSSAPGFDTTGKTYFLRIEKEGDSYTCYRSDDGEDFAEMFAYTETGIDPDEIIIDAYTGMTANYKFILKSLTIEGEGAASGLASIDFTDPASADRFTVVNQEVTGIREGEGLYLVSTQNSIESSGRQLTTEEQLTPKDLVLVPVEGDWTATMKVKFNDGGSAGHYEYLGFYAMDDYNNFAGMRAGDESLIDFLKVDGNETRATVLISDPNTSTCLPSSDTHWFRIAKTGTSYVCYWSTDGENFTECFSFADTGVEAKSIMIDAYSGSSTGYNYLVEYLNFGEEGPEPCEHDYVAVVTAPTCTEKGYTTYTCSKCGDSYVADETAALGHDFGEWAVTKAATCTEAGEETRTCARCGEKQTRAIAALGHDFKDGKCTRCGADDPNYVPPAEGSYVKANVIEPGMTYVIVADGAYAMTNEEVAGKESYAGFSTTRGAKAVTIEDGIITSEVTPDMLWTFNEADAAAAYDGLDQYFITDANGKYLRRGSMSQSNGALVLENDTTAGNIRYYTWSFKPYDGEEATYAMYANSERAYGTDYPGRVGGNASGFDIPGGLSHRSDGDPFAFMNDSGCSKITLYVLLGVEPCDHDYVPVVTAPTCTEKGYTTYTCSKCGKSYKGDETAALGHAFGEWVTTTAATCTAAGVQTRSCSRCDAKETKAIAATGHSYGEWTVTKAATCTEAGVETRTCANCDAKETRAIAATGHTFGEWAVTKAATCTAAGEETRTCSKCGEKETKAIEALGHNFVDGVCTRCGEKDPTYVPPVDYTALNAAIEAAEAIDLSKYTDASVEAFNKALADAKAAKTADTQAAVDAAKAALDAAKDKLVEKPVVEPFRFDDVKDSNQYYYEPVYWAYEHEPQITNGTSKNLFSPEKGCTRAQVVTFLWRYAGMPEPNATTCNFKDVDKEQYYYKAVLWAVEKKITNGTSETTFDPEKTCTRAQIVTFLWRYAGEPKPATTKNDFKDVKDSAYYYNAVLWAAENDITNGTSATTFDPEKTCTRAQIVTFLYRAQPKEES